MAALCDTPTVKMTRRHRQPNPASTAPTIEILHRHVSRLDHVGCDCDRPPLRSTLKWVGRAFPFPRLKMEIVGSILICGDAVLQSGITGNPGPASHRTRVRLVPGKYRSNSTYWVALLYHTEAVDREVPEPFALWSSCLKPRNRHEGDPPETYPGVPEHFFVNFFVFSTFSLVVGRSGRARRTSEGSRGGTYRAESYRLIWMLSLFIAQRIAVALYCVGSNKMVAEFRLSGAIL
jgi:hypothetical protein